MLLYDWLDIWAFLVIGLPSLFCWRLYSNDASSNDTSESGYMWGRVIHTLIWQNSTGTWWRAAPGWLICIDRSAPTLSPLTDEVNEIVLHHPATQTDTVAGQYSSLAVRAVSWQLFSNFDHSPWSKWWQPLWPHWWVWQWKRLMLKKKHISEFVWLTLIYI